MSYTYEDRDDGGFAVITNQDAEPMIESNKKDQSDGNFRLKNDDEGQEWWHVGCIPNIIVIKWLNEGIDIYSNDPDMKKAVARKLNDSDWRWLKSADVRV